MAPSLLALLYRSQATRHLDRAAILELLVTAREHNERAGISGLLIRRGDEFMQLLEGPEDAVRDLAATIASDPRHTRFTITHEEHPRARRFQEWNMAFDGGDPLDVALHPGARPFGAPLPPHDGSDPVLEALAAFQNDATSR